MAYLSLDRALFIFLVEQVMTAVCVGVRTKQSLEIVEVKANFCLYGYFTKRVKYD
jgi:hypothetical protein